LLVKKGQLVNSGSIIGNVGDTGSAVGPHLHFELNKDGIAVDPLIYVDIK
jgi:murein DD-endopeptidase MepM/ murein hydrolase activator NlpD